MVISEKSNQGPSPAGLKRALLVGGDPVPIPRITLSRFESGMPKRVELCSVYAVMPSVRPTSGFVQGLAASVMIATARK